MSSQESLPIAQLLVFKFGPDARFEGQLGGAIERFESVGSLRVLEGLFIQREAESGELAVIDVRGDGTGSLIGPVLSFRLDPAARRRATDSALAEDTPGISGDTVRELAGSLAPGAAIVALLIQHVWAETLQDAIVRTGGAPLLNQFVGASTLNELATELIAAADRGGAPAHGA